MHAGLGAQPAVRVIADHIDGRTLDSGHLAVALINDFGLDAMRIRPLEIHAQQHRRPILRFGAACAGLDVEERIVRVHLAGEHPLKLESLDFLAQAANVGFDFQSGAGIAFGDGQLEDFRGVAQAGFEPLQAADDLFEFGTFLPEFLRTLGNVPNAGLLELAFYFLQALLFVVVIKDTSSKSRCALRDL